MWDSCCFPRRDLHSTIPRPSRLQTRCRAGTAGRIPLALGEVLSTKWGSLEKWSWVHFQNFVA